MARTILTATTACGSYPSLPLTANSADLAMSAADIADLNQVVATGKDLVFAHNTNVGAQTITITSAANKRNRTGDITAYSIGAGEYAVFGPFDSAGWMQSTGYLYFQASHAEVKLGVVSLP